MRVVTTYGSAETCGGCVYDGFPLEDVLVRVEEDGRILLGGATIAAGYLDAPELSAETFIEEDGVRWYRTNDLGELDADGRLTVLGRADDVVITGGLKVSAAHVQAELEKLDGVRAAFVAGVPSAEWGHALAAYVAVADSSPEGTGGVRRPPERDLGAGAGCAGPENGPARRGTAHAAQRQTRPPGHDGPAGCAASGKIDKPPPAAGRRFNQPTSIQRTNEVLTVATAAQWIQGARLRTLPAAIAPVLIGSAAAYEMDSFILLNAVLAALVALLLQIGVNYANDYSDGIRGTDEDRVGPLRLVGSGAASPEHVKRAAFAAFGLAMLFGLILVIITQAWWLILVGIGCVLAAWGYTGGKNPYGYLGLGDVFVFVFFGLVATLGTTYTQAGQLSLAAIIGAIGTGLIACALLMANNVRDIPTDRKAGKKTLAVRLGDKHARESYVLMLGRRDPAGHRPGPRPAVDADRAAADPRQPHAVLADDLRAAPQEPHPGPEADRAHQPRLRRAVFTGLILSHGF